ncbi:sugar transferase [Microbacterium azadirachtae]|uniref:Undecaprenyl phosphate N,N'-diacetylbacillosamine 1-phosphate transferase n=1 Tax=Microbacterium azadirachtae TaxID=582680 RepID=A0A0F0LQC0_9MICO|nr:sugar transferase [Microbacterium azadirachtae]KJL34470.1 Undecaprenyl phosphate N,N'-diacetylbacillosamine 1-phosphate transferase [Microbacterium azadirachtae]
MTTRAYDLFKRLLDIVAAGIALVVLSPVMVIVALLVATRLGRPVLFVQPRPGKNGKIFRLRKFRSMRDIDQARGLVSDAERLTTFGRKLRSTSLDELPSLWNVLRGDMSVVGPRPLLVEYLSKYSPEQARRHEVRPGITGLAQVSGRNALSWEEKFALDVEYVDNRSLALDARLVLATVRAVFVREGISAEGHATMQKFGETNA